MVLLKGLPGLLHLHTSTMLGVKIKQCIRNVPSHVVYPLARWKVATALKSSSSYKTGHIPRQMFNSVGKRCRSSSLGNHMTLEASPA